MKKYYEVRYKEILKLATSEFKRSSDNNNGNYGSPVLSIMDIIAKHNAYSSPSVPK